MPDTAQVVATVSATAPTATEARDEAAATASQLFFVLLSVSWLCCVAELTRKLSHSSVPQADGLTPADLATSYISVHPNTYFNQTTDSEQTDGEPCTKPA